jgi:hypothetical protein
VTTIVRYLVLFVWAAVPLLAQEDPDIYEGNISYPVATPAALDSLNSLGVMPVWVPDTPKLYWARSKFTIAMRGTYRGFMNQAIRGGLGTEANIAVPAGPSDYGYFLFARANYYTILNPTWLRWDLPAGTHGVLYNGGVGASFNIPLSVDGFSMPMMLGAGLAFFQPEDARPAETYIGLEPGLGIHYRLTPTIGFESLIQGSWLVSAASKRNRGFGTWNFSLGFHLALAPQRHEPLQRWVPPLVVTARDVEALLTREPIEALDILDRNLDFINTELKPLTGFTWYYLGFNGIVRGTVIASSRAASGNVTALDIKLDSADIRGFRVWRVSVPIQFSPQTATDHFKSNNPSDSAFIYRKRQLDFDKIAGGDYAQRDPSVMGIRYLRAELFPAAKGALDQVPKVGSRVVVSGVLAWDGDGHLEIHPMRPSDVKLINGEFLDSDDDLIIE